MENFATAEFIIGVVFGFIFSTVFLLRSLKKTGAGNCKMCKTCEYYVAFEKAEENIGRAEEVE